MGRISVATQLVHIGAQSGQLSRVGVLLVGKAALVKTGVCIMATTQGVGFARLGL